jgi:CHAT domain-containing protein
VRILAVSNPTLDLPLGEAEVTALRSLAGKAGPLKVQVSELTRDRATLANFAEMLAADDFDILHFAGHGSLDSTAPETSALRFNGGLLSADDVLKLPWKAPPYLVFNSACESGRAAGGKRLASEEGHYNGLAAAFLSAGVYGYAGYFWPVTETGASGFTESFYKSLFQRENVGLAFLEARKKTVQALGEIGDLTGYSAVLFGDAASKHRRDLAMAA